MTSPIFDYSDHVELIDAGKGLFRWNPTGYEVIRSARRYIEMEDIPDDFYDIAQAKGSIFVLEAFMYYCAVKRGVIDKCGYKKTYCPYCQTKLDHIINPPDYSDLDFQKVFVKEYNHCGWWQSNEQFVRPNSSMGSVASVYKTALLKQFDINGIDTPIEILKQYLVRNSGKLNLLTPRKMELLVTSVFKDFFNGEAIHLGGPNDQGIDVLLFSSDVQYAIQVKRRYNPLKSEPVHALRDFIGALLLNNCTKGIYVTNACKFSKPSIMAAREVGKNSNIEFIELYNAKRFLDVCKRTLKNNIPHWQNCSSKKNAISQHGCNGMVWFFNIAHKGGKFNRPGALDPLKDLKNKLEKQFKYLQLLENQLLDDLYDYAYKSGSFHLEFKEGLTFTQWIGLLEGIKYEFMSIGNNAIYNADSDADIQGLLKAVDPVITFYENTGMHLNNYRKKSSSRKDCIKK